MKYFKDTTVLTLGILLALIYAGCGSETNPSASSGSLITSNSAPTNTPTVTPGPPIIVALISQIGPNAVVYVSNSSGTTGVANCAATLFTQGVTAVMTNQGLSSPQSYLYGKKFDFGFPLSITGTYFSSQPNLNNGQTYLFNVAVNNTVYSASVTYNIDSSMGVSIITGKGIYCSWNPALTNYDFAGILSSNIPSSATPVTQIGPPLPTEPCTILNSAFTNETSPGSGSDEMVLFLDQIQTGAFAGSNSQSTAGTIQWTYVPAY